MRSCVLSLVLFLASSLCVQAQPQERTFAEFRQTIEAPPSVVEDEARTLAKKDRHLRGIAQPEQQELLPVLIPGSVLLRFDGAPFTLYLHSNNHHTEAVLESQKIELSEQAREEAQSFLQQVANQTETKDG